MSYLKKKLIVTENKMKINEKNEFKICKSKKKIIGIGWS